MSGWGLIIGLKELAELLGVLSYLYQCRSLTGQSLSEGGTQPEEVPDGLQPLEEEHLLHELSLTQVVKEVKLRGSSLPQDIHLPPGQRQLY